MESNGNTDLALLSTEPSTENPPEPIILILTLVSSTVISMKKK